MVERPSRPRHAARAALAATLTLALALASAWTASAPAGEPAPGTEPQVSLTPVGGSYQQPVYATGAPGTPRTLYVVERAGRIEAVRRGRALERPFLDISARVSTAEEDGLLSLAFHPGYERNRRAYVFYVSRQGNLRLDEFKRDREVRTRADRSTRRPVLRIAHPNEGSHNGNHIAFGPDALLYAAVGDGGGCGDPGSDARDPASLLGKILRIDPRPREGAPYTVPPTNPFAGSAPGAGEVFSLGLRNPWRFSFDREAGAIAIGDVGQYALEEIDYATLADARGADFGWDHLEGSQPFVADGFCDAPDGPAPASPLAPVHEYSSGSGSGNCAVTGGYVVRDQRLPSLLGRYLYADFCGGDIRAFVPSPSGATGDATLGLEVSRPVSFGEDLRRRLYVVAYDASAAPGHVYRLDPASTARR